MANISMGVSTLVRMLLGIMKTKVSAILLGPEGVGIIGLVSQMQLFGMSLSSFSIGSGLSTNISMALEQKDRNKRIRTINTAFSLLVISNLLFLICFGFSLTKASQFIFHRDDQIRYLIPMLLSVPLHAFLGSFFMGIFFGHEKIKDYTLASIVAAGIEAVAFLFLIKFFGITGVLWSVTFGFLVWFLASTVLVSKFEKLRNLIRFKIDPKAAKDLLSYGTVMSASGLMTYFSNSFLRAYFARTLGVHENGIYHVVLVFSSLYMPFLTNAIWARLHPRVSSAGLTEEAEKEWSEAILTMMLFGSAIQIGVTFFSNIAIRILYTRQFLPAAQYLPVQMLGDYFFLLAQPSMAVILARGKLKTYLISWCAFFAIQLSSTYLLVAKFQIFGATYGYLLASLMIGSITAFIYLRRLTSFRRKINSILVFAFSFSCLLFAYSVSQRSRPLELTLVLATLYCIMVGAIYFLKPLKERIFI